MKKIALLSAILVFLPAACSFAEATHSERAVEESLKASSHASKSGAHAIAASGQTVSAASAVPFAVVGSVGAVSAGIAEGLMNAATAHAGTPLPLTDETVTAGPPPNEALRTKTDPKP